ncbi:methylation-associated defense system protein MAD7 [Pseudonocardia sp. CA-107938]|uniref:methylation-associated defense system protein MAD7 n=1 Tax=Pseudonocardia sp. CA-107938 TaxID=3240021 RepID=UPI003D8C640E
MTITLPVPLRTYQYRPLTVFSLLDTDPDRVLPSLFEMCVKGGRSSRSRTDARDYLGYRQALLDSGAVSGFSEKRDLALLDGWLRSCVVDMGTVGRSGTGEQMLSIAPLTLAAYRAGLPKERTRHRGIDDVVYRLLLDAVAADLADAGPGAPTAALRELVTRTLGRGLAIGPAPTWEPRLDDPAELDVGALLAFRFVEGFAMGDAREVASTAPDSPLPGVTAALGRMLLDHLRVYGDRLPVPALMSSFAALMTIGVLGYTQRADAAARELLRTGEAPPDMGDGAAPPSPLELYCDFTGVLGSESDRMSRACVARDLDRVRLAFRDRMTFVVVENALPRIPAEAERRGELSAAARLVQLAQLREHKRIESYAENRIDDLVAQAQSSPDATGPDLDLLERLQRSDIAELDKLLDLLEHVNQDKAVRNAAAWFKSVGGIEKPYGLLRGDVRNRRSWRYAPGDELLTALLLAVFVEPGGSGHCAAMPLRDVLAALAHRFGILVDRPPAFLDGAEAREAATANREAFTQRLQLLGCFDSLSDDFSVQIVRHPLGDPA